MLHRSVSIIMLRIDYRMPLGLMIQPAAQIVRELPPRPKSYCVTLFFHAGRYLPLSNVWSTVVVGWSLRIKKAVTTALGRNPQVKTKGESMHNGFQSLRPTATIKL